MLSPLQEQVAEIIAGLKEAEGFALAGGAALIVRGDVRRQTRDLDFFGLTADAVDRLVPVEAGRLAPTLTGEELAVDKVLAVFGRAEARDFVDLMALEPRYGLDRLCALAAEKDRGFTPVLFAEMLGRFSRLRQEEFGIDAQQYQQLAREIVRWREQAIELSHRRQHGQERERDLGPEL